MLDIEIPGHDDLHLEHLVLDYNGTLAVDGEMIRGVHDALVALSGDLKIHVLTADTFGKAQSGLKDTPGELVILPVDRQAEGKRKFVRQLGAKRTVCIGNGRNDWMMLQAAALGIAVIQREGAAGLTLNAAAVVCPDILSALELLTNPLRLVATLRS